MDYTAAFVLIVEIALICAFLIALIFMPRRRIGPPVSRRRRHRGSLVLPSLLAVFLLAPAVAFAQDTRVPLDPFIAWLMPYIEALFAAIITAAIAWVSMMLKRWTGIQIEAKHREALQSALLNGARAIVQRNAPDGLSIDVRSVPLKTGIEFVLSSVPEAVEYFGLTPADIEKHLRPKLVAVVGGASG